MFQQLHATAMATHLRRQRAEQIRRHHGDDIGHYVLREDLPGAHNTRNSGHVHHAARDTASTTHLLTAGTVHVVYNLQQGHALQLLATGAHTC